MKQIWGFLIMVAVILLAFLVFVYFYLNIFLEKAAWAAIDFISQGLTAKGVEIQDPDFNKASILLPPAISVSGISATLNITKRNLFQVNRNFYFTINSVILSLDNLAQRSFIITINGMVVKPQRNYNALDDTGGKATGYDRLEISQLQIPLKINRCNRNEAISQVQALTMDLAQFVKFGTTDIAMRMSGVSAFLVRDKPVQGRLFLAPQGRGMKLVMDPNDFRAVAAALGETLTEAEFDVYCNNPIRMPQMLRIRNYAKETAGEAHRQNPGVPEKAYRNILWAYLLTKAYDEQFSAETTDSHLINPIGPDVEHKGDSEIHADLTNNLLGREYARNGYAESSILNRMMSDTRVIRNKAELEFSPVPTAQAQ